MRHKDRVIGGLRFGLLLVVAVWVSTAIAPGGRAYAAAAPTLSAISPTSGGTAGGDSVTLTGTNFASGDTVSIGGNVASSVTVVNSTTITTLTPAGTAGSKAEVVVTDTSGNSAALSSAFTYNDPSLIGWWKLDGNATDSSSAGHNGTVNGATATTGYLGFANTALSFNGSSNYINMGNVDNMGTGSLTVSAWFKTTTSTAGGKVQGIVSKALNGGQLGRYFMIMENGNVEGGFDSSGTSGVLITTPETPYINGAWHLATVVFDRAGSESLYVDGVLKSSTSMSAAAGVNMNTADNLYIGAYNDSTGTAPMSGMYFNGSIDDARIYNRALSAAEVSNLYTGSPVTVNNISPNTGKAAGGDSVTINGTGFAVGDTVTIGGAAATGVTVINDTTITATTPAGAAGATNVVVTSSGGQSATLAGGFTYLPPPPTITGISPTSGSTAGGDAITITGTNFFSGDTVTIGGNAATGITVVNGTTITATTPAGTTGAADVVVTDKSLQAAKLSSGFTYVSPPTISSVSPSRGNMTGGYTVTIAGSNFTSGDTVSFGGTPATNVTVANRTYAIGQTGPGGGIIFYDKGNNTGGWRYLEAAPSDQSSGLLWCSSWTNTGASGTAVGTGHSDTATIIASSCSADAAKAAANYTGGGHSDWFLPSKDELNQLYAERSVVGGFGTGGYWSSSQGDSDPSQQAWEQNFGSGAQQAINQTYAYSVRAIREVSSDTIITATVPAAASAGTVSVTVTDSGGHSSTLASGFTYLPPPPTITGISPTGGTTVGGDTVTISGTDFTSGDTVTIGGSAATNITVVNSTTITATTPAGTAGAADVVVTDSSFQSATLSGGFTYVNPAPTITSFTPVVGKMQGGDTVTFTGSGFTSAMTADFNGTAATTVSATGTTLTVKTPAGALGDATVTITAPQTQTATAPGSFRYAPDAYAFTTAPQTLHATQSGFMTVEARDTNGNVVTAPYAITLNLTSSSAGGSFSADGTTWGMMNTTIPAGQSSVSFYYKDADKGTPSVTATGPANVSVSQTETITSRYILLVTGVSDPINAGVPSSVTVQATDWQGVAVNDYTGTVHFTSDDAYASLPSDFTITSAMQGHHTFVNAVTMVTGGEHCVTATDTSDSAVTGAQCNITVNNSSYSGTISKLAIITDPQSTENSQPTSAITVQTQDSNGNPVPVPADTTIYVSSSSSTGSFSSDGVSGWSGTQPFTITIKAKTSSADIYYKDTANGTKTLSFRDQAAMTDTGFTDTTQPVYIGAGPPASLSMNAPASQIYGSWVPVTVSLNDAAGVPATNPDSPLPIYFTSDNAAVTFSASSSGSSAATSLQATIPVGGDHVTVYAHTADSETATLTASDASPPNGSTGLADASHLINFVAPSPSQLTMSTGASSVAVNTPVAITLTTLNNLGQQAASTTDTTISLNDRNHGGSFSLSGTTWSAVSSVVLPAGDSSVTVYYKATAAGGVTLEASGISTATADITITPGNYTQLVFTAGPISVPVTEATNYAVSAEDMYGNVTTVASDTAVYLYANAGNFAANANGPWTATRATIPAGGSSVSFYYRNTTLGSSATLTASDQTPLDNPDSGIVNATRTITVTGQAAAQLAFTTAPQTIAVGASSGVITVEAQKADGSPAEQGQDLTVSLSSTSAGSYGFTATADPNAAAITTVTIPAGGSSVSFYYHDTKTGTPTLGATAGGLDATQSITLTTDFASQLSFVTPPQNGQTNQPSQQIEITAADSYGNTAPVSADTTVTLTSDCADSSFSLSSDNWSPVTQVIIPSGSAAAYFYFKTSAASCTMTVSASGLGKAAQVFTATTGPAQIAFSGVPTSLEAGQSATVNVSLEDASGNLVPALSDTTVYVAASSGTVDSGALTIRSGQSTASFTFTAGSAAGSAQLQARDEPSASDPDTGLVNAAATVNITAPVASRLSITPATGNATVNTPQQLTVQLTNAYGIAAPTASDTTVVLATDGPGTFTATATAGAPAITNVIIPAGSTAATFYYDQTTSGTVHLSTSSGNLTPGTSTLTVLSGQITTYQYVTAPTTAEVGQTQTFSIQALDKYGNIVTLQPGQYIYLSSSSATGIFSGNGYAADTHALVVQQSGTVVSFNYRDTSVGSDTLTASDTYPPDNPDTGITNAVSSVAITAGVPAKLVFTTAPNAFERGGTSNQMDVTVENAYDVVTPVSSDTTLRLASNSPTGQFAAYNTGPWALSTVTIPANADTASFYYHDNTNTGSYTLTVSSDTLAQASQSVTVQQGTAASLAFITPPQTLYATHASPGIVLGVDNRYGYPTVMDTQHIASFSSSSATAQFANTLPNWGSTSQPWPAGAANITIYYRDSTRGKATLSAQVGSLGTTVQNATILQQVFDHFLVTNISDPQTAGTPSSVVVIAQDAADYTVAGYDGTIHFTSSDPAAILPADYTFQPYADKGLHTFVNGVIFSTAGEQTVTATDTATGQSGRQEAITVNGPTGSGSSTTSPGSGETPVPGAGSGSTPGRGGENGGSTGSGISGSRPSGSGAGTGSRVAPRGSSILGDTVSTAIQALGQFSIRVIKSPAAPYVLPGIFYFIVIAFAAVLLWDMYREIRTADILLAVLKRERQTSEDKLQFLNLVAHHVRTPITIIAGGAELAGSLLKGDATAKALSDCAQRLQTTANKLVQSITVRVSGADEAELPAQVTLERKLYLSPLFWMPVIVSLALTWLINWLATAVGHQNVHAATIALQLLVAGLVAALLYSALRGRNLRRRRKEALEQSLAHRQQLDDGKNAFVRSAGTELQRYVKELKPLDADLQQKHPTGAKPLHNGVQQLQKLVDTLNTLSSIDTTRLRTDRFELAAVLDQALLAHNDQIAGKRLDVATGGNLHEPLTQDQQLLGRVADTLLDNAIAFSPEGGKIRVATSETAEATTLSITDSGPGLPRAVTEQLLQPFTHAEDTFHETHQGLGLSLYLDSLIMRHLGGSLKAQSNQKGTTITLTIPKTTPLTSLT